MREREKEKKRKRKRKKNRHAVNVHSCCRHSVALLFRYITTGILCFISARVRAPDFIDTYAFIEWKYKGEYTTQRFPNAGGWGWNEAREILKKWNFHRRWKLLLDNSAFRDYEISFSSWVCSVSSLVDRLGFTFKGSVYNTWTSDVSSTRFDFIKYHRKCKCNLIYY